MSVLTSSLPPAFPAIMWVLIEQPPGARYRFEYNPEDGTFHETAFLSLVYDRGFTGAYGWIDGLGHPPDRHCDVLLVTRQSLQPGDRVLAHTCGIFYRGDGDHKVVVLDDALRNTVTQPNLAALDAQTAAELRACYPRLGGGEGWWDAEETQAYLRHWERMPAEIRPGGAPLWGPGGLHE